MHEETDSVEGMPPSLKIVPTIYPTSKPLAEEIDRFWSVGTEFDFIQIRIEPPGEPLAILEKLGPSPFAGTGFPLIGFLATTYDKVSRYALEHLDRNERPNYE